MTKIDAFDSLTCEYDTGTVPPPFCHRYKIKITRSKSQVLQIDLKLEYYDRDEINEEEIFDEGFTLEDDFVWKGILPEIWEKEITEKLNSTSWRKKLTASQDGSEFIIKLVNKDKTEILQPADTRAWENFCQEIIQAVFELGKKEAPLFISYVYKLSKHHKEQVDFEYSFSTRKIRITNPGNKQKSLEWVEGRLLLKHIFSLDYVPEDGLEDIPIKQGNYISPGDGLWYELSQKNNAGNSTNEKIKKLVNTLNTYFT